jgi:hypothetical protein
MSYLAHPVERQMRKNKIDDITAPKQILTERFNVLRF